MARHPLHKMISPRQLLAQVRSAVPYRFPGPKNLSRINGSFADKAKGTLGWWDILTSAKHFQLSKNPSTQEFIDYFALCLAAHYCTVASYVPTDVDSKIRKHIWHYASAPGIIERMCDIVLAAMQWDRQAISARQVIDPTEGQVSGLEGEWLSVLIPGMHAAHKHGLHDRADALWAIILDEIKREERMFHNSLRDDDTLRCLKLSAILSHNAGDIDQGIESSPIIDALKERVDSIKHMAKAGEQNPNSAFAIASHIYRQCMAKEFHRHYPLREISLLRQHPDFAFPMSPFLDDWARTLAQHETLELDQQLEILGGLIHACDVVANQDGYYRAVSSFIRHHSDQQLIHYLPVNLSQRLRQDDFQKHLSMDAEQYLALKHEELHTAMPELNPERIQFYMRE